MEDNKITTLLKWFDILASIMMIFGILSFGYGILSLFNDGPSGIASIAVAISCAISWAFLSGFAYIIKAANIYIKKEESEEEKEEE